MIRNLLIAAVLLLAAAGGYLLRQELRQNDVAAVNTAPVAPGKVSFSLPDLDGTSRDFAEWDGKARIVNFWATWCAPCRREIPLLKQTQAAHGGNGLQVIGIAVDFAEDVIKYAEDAEFNYPILVGQEDAMAVAESSGVEFIGLPFTMIVTPTGDLLGVHLGEIHQTQMDAIIVQLTGLEQGDISFEQARNALRKL